MWNIIFWALVLMKAYQWFILYKVVEINKPTNYQKYHKWNIFSFLSEFQGEDDDRYDPTEYFVIDNRRKDDYIHYVYFGFISFFIYRLWYKFSYDKEN